jgi:hypothetical protein
VKWSTDFPDRRGIPIIHLGAEGVELDEVAVAEDGALPVSARMMNSWERSPPMGPVSAAMGIARSPRRWKVRR